MAKRKKPKYYAYQLGGSTNNYNWGIPDDNTPSVVNQTATGATDIYGNQYFKPDETGDPTTNNPDIVPIGNKKNIWDLLGNTNKTLLNPAVQNLNTVMQGVTGVASMINEVNNRKYEKDQQLKAITPKYYENMEGYGLNANPVFTQYGGGTGKYVHTTGVKGDRYLNAVSVKDSQGRIPWDNKEKIIQQIGTFRDRDVRHIGSVDLMPMTTLRSGYDIAIPDNGYTPMDLNQPTNFSATYPTGSGQQSVYFPNKGAWQGFLNSGALSGVSSSETPNTGTAAGYRTMQTGGQLAANSTPAPDPTDQYYSANAQLAYFKDKLNAQLKAKNPQGFQDYFKGLVDLRRKGDTTGAQNYVQSTAYNDFLTPDEVKSTLGDDYDRYLKSLQAVNNYNVSQGRQPLWGTEEGQNDVTKLNYGRRFASLQVTPSYTQTNTTRGTSYSRDYKYNPATQNVDIAETGDLSIRPSNFTIPNKNVMKNGGMPKTYGLQEGGKALANVEAEKGEAFQTNDGQIGQVANDANTHEQGGVFLPNVHRVLENTSNIRKDRNSKILKLSPEDVEQTTGMPTNKAMSHAEALVNANDYYEDQRNKITKKIELGAKSRDSLDKYAELSTRLNMDHFKSLPTQQQLFDSLFNRQEMVKAATGIPTDGQDTPEAKTGIHIKPENRGKFTAYKKRTGKTTEEALHSKDPHVRQMANFARNAAKWHHAQYGVDTTEPQYMQLAGYAGSKTGMKTPAGHSDAFPATQDFTFQNYLDELKAKGFKYEGINNAADFQTALYDYQLKNNPDAIRKMWGEGMHQKGMTQARQMGLVDDKGLFKPGVLDDPKNLEKLKTLYPDGILGPRTMRLVAPDKKPTITWPDDTPAKDIPVAQDLDTSITPINIKQQKRSGFYEPLRWYDTASATNSYLAALEREPGKYNPMEFNQLRYKLLDPTAALQQNQADFNASVQGVQDMSANNPGGAAANVANLAAQKYAANNQVLGNYENQNAQIKNNEITYNTQVRDKNSLADQQAREVFENKVLQSKATQQEQKLTSLDALYKTIADNRALNRNGNLIMKYSRAFDQYGDYNGYQPLFSVNPALGMPTTPTTVGSAKTTAAGGVQNVQAGKSYYNRKTGKTLYFDGTKLVER